MLRALHKQILKKSLLTILHITINLCTDKNCTELQVKSCTNQWICKQMVLKWPRGKLQQFSQTMTFSKNSSWYQVSIVLATPNYMGWSVGDRKAMDTCSLLHPCLYRIQGGGGQYDSTGTQQVSRCSKWDQCPCWEVNSCCGKGMKYVVEASR